MSALLSALRKEPELSKVLRSLLEDSQPRLALIQELSKHRLLYFAYGSNLLSSRIQAANRAPGAVSLGAAQLEGHCLVFDLPGMIEGETAGGGVANIRPSPGASLWGALYWMPQPQLVRLNNLEAGFGYRVLFEPVVSPVFGVLKAYYYLAEAQLVVEAAPTEVYRRYLIDGALEQRLPEGYRQQLQSQMDRLQKA
ncbi:MAG: gamma-glutamylcyclotransferase family protein [bacterium]|nr:gamma-glutamylcyclotransferase family protein [bacterium]